MGETAGESVKLGEISSSIEGKFWINAPLSGCTLNHFHPLRPLSIGHPVRVDQKPSTGLDA